MKKLKTKWGCLLLITILCFLWLTGCNSKVKLESDMLNVEQRDYATILLVGTGSEGKNYAFSLGIAQEKKVGEKSQTENVVTLEADNLEELAIEYGAVKGKSLSLVHLKAILLENDGNTAVESFGDIINQMDEYEDIAKTCPVLQLKEREEFLNCLKEAKEPVGSYLNDLIKMVEGEGKEIPQLKDYRKVMREEVDLQVYFLEKVPEGWKLTCRAEIAFLQEKECFGKQS